MAGGMPRAGASSIAAEAQASQAGALRQVNTGGLRNEVPLTNAQRAEAGEYARSLGMPGESIRYSEFIETSYGPTFDMLIIGTDVLPRSNVGLGTFTANSRISMRGAIAHEILGHRAAALAGRTQAINALEEAQASIRAARFAPDLTSTERYTLLRDAITRLHNAGFEVREVRGQLWVTQPQPPR